MAKRGVTGIPIDNQTWREILDAAEVVGIAQSDALEMAQATK